jgi:hypothetical protein
MQYKDLREFIQKLEEKGELKRISLEIDPNLEMTEICDRTLRAGGPALLFEKPKGHSIPVLGNLFGTPRRVAMGMGEDDPEKLREIGKLLAFLKEPDPPKGVKDAWQTLPIFKKVLDMAPKTIKKAPCQEIIIEKDKVDLEKLPIQTCWPGDAGPLITWGLVLTKGPQKKRQNIGIYRQQVIGPNRVIMRWLAQRGGALDFQDWQAEHPGEPFPIAVALGLTPPPYSRRSRRSPIHSLNMRLPGYCVAPAQNLLIVSSANYRFQPPQNLFWRVLSTLTTWRKKARLAITQGITMKWSGFLSLPLSVLRTVKIPFITRLIPVARPMNLPYSG